MDEVKNTPNEQKMDTEIEEKRRDLRMKTMKNIADLAIEMDGKIFGGFIRDYFVKHLHNQGTEEKVKDIDIMFCDKKLAENFIKNINKDMKDILIKQKPTTSGKTREYSVETYPNHFQLYNFSVFSKQKQFNSFEIDIIIGNDLSQQNFPQDFSVNMLILDGKGIHTRMVLEKEVENSLKFVTSNYFNLITKQIFNKETFIIPGSIKANNLQAIFLRIEKMFDKGYDIIDFIPAPMNKTWTITVFKINNIAKIFPNFDKNFIKERIGDVCPYCREEYNFDSDDLIFLSHCLHSMHFKCAKKTHNCNTRANYFNCIQCNSILQ